MLFCTVVYKNKNTSDNTERKRLPRSGSEGIALVNPVLPVLEIRESHSFESPVKTGTFSKAKGKEFQKALKQIGEETESPMYANLSAKTEIPVLSSISFDTFVGARKKVSKAENEYDNMTGVEGAYINVPPIDPTAAQETDELNDKDDSPLVSKEKILGEETTKEPTKTELTKKQSNPYQEITLVHGGTVVREGVYDLLEKK